MTQHDYYVIQYRVADGPWKHGRSIEPWVYHDKAVLRDQRRYTVEDARNIFEGGVAERITTRVLDPDEGQRRLDEQDAQRRPVPVPDDEPDFDVQLPPDRPIPAVLGETEWTLIDEALRAQYDGAAHRLADRIRFDVLTR